MMEGSIFIRPEVRSEDGVDGDIEAGIAVVEEVEALGCGFVDPEP